MRIGINYPRITNATFLIATLLLSIPLIGHTSTDASFEEAMDKLQTGERTKDIEAFREGVLLLEETCENGHGEACFFSGLVYGESDLPQGFGGFGNHAKAKVALDEACQHGYKEACEINLNLTERCNSGDKTSCFFREAKQLLSQDPTELQETLNKFKELCKDGIGFACAEVARHMVDQGEHKKAIALLQEACDAGIGNACSIMDTQKQQD